MIAAHTCTQCRQSFEITSEDIAFYDKVAPVIAGKKEAFPPPTLCPDCRTQRKLAYRNERIFHRRTSDSTGESIISIYAPDNAHKVYELDEWWKDSWDPLDHGRDFDFSRPFFEQFAELYRAIPHPALVNINNENCDYVNQCGYSQNCYMAVKTDYSEDCLYTDTCITSKQCMDSLNVTDCELCYECVNCSKCYGTFHSADCSNCPDCFFCLYCRGCRSCFGCSGLRNAQYHIFNEPVGKEKFERFMKEVSWSPDSIAEYRKKTDSQKLSKPHPHTIMTNCENCTGDYLTNCKNAVCCFDSKDIEDSKFLIAVPNKMNDAYDIVGGLGEMLYDSFSVGPGYHCLFCGHCWDNVSELLYCMFCMKGSYDLFGCAGMKHNSYCILNKQYTKEQYEALVPKIIEHMRKTKEWGEFFPASMSPFPYNETVAQEHFPLDRAAAMKKGWQWREIKDEVPQVTKIIPGSELPASISDIPDDVLNWAIRCEQSSRPFRIVKQELEFYRTHGLPLPRLHPDIRHQRRTKLRNPRHLWERKCDKCKKQIQTTFAPERPEIVYCEDCYLKEVY